MTFVYPLLLGGLLLAGLPVLLHFFIRKKPTTLVFPAFRFLLQKERSNTRSMRLRHLLLLLLRVLLVALACLALARPRLFHAAFGLSREKPIAVALVFDTSPSMAYKHDDVTRLDLAKKRAAELLDELPGDCLVLVLDTAEPAPAREDFHRSMDHARQRIAGLTIRDHGVSVRKRIEDALERLAQLDDDGRDLPRVVCAFSDRTRASWPMGTSAKPQANGMVYYFDVGIDGPVDVAITHAELPRSHLGAMQQSFAAGERIPLRTAIQATGKDQEAVVVCKIGANELRQVCHVKAGEQQTMTFDIDSEKWTLQPGYHQAELNLETPDALAFNNQRFVTFKIRTPGRLLVLTDDAAKPKRFVSALKALLYAIEVRPADGFGTLDHDAVFLDGVATPSEKLWQALTAYLEKGGGVGIVPPGDDMLLAAYNGEAAQRVMPGRVVGKITQTGEDASWNPAPDELLHPLLLPYGAWIAEGTSDFLRYPRNANRFWQVKPTPGVGNTLVHYAGGQPAIVERIGKGKVLLLTTPLEEQKPEWTNYFASNTSFYIALTWLCARYLTPEQESVTVNYRFGSEPPMLKAPLVAFPKYMLTGPEKVEDVRFDESGRWFGDRLSRAGNYTLVGTTADKLEPRSIGRFSINVPGEESDLTRIAVAEIEAVFGTGSVVPQDRRTSLADSLHWDEPIELFPWVMLAVLFLLAIENLLANRFYRADTK